MKIMAESHYLCSDSIIAGACDRYCSLSRGSCVGGRFVNKVILQQECLEQVSVQSFLEGPLG